MEDSKNIRISRLKHRSMETVDDRVAVEKRLRILVNGENVINLYCSPVMIRELVVGIVHNEGLLSGEWCTDRISIDYSDEITVDIPYSGAVHGGSPTITSGCAGGISLKTDTPEQSVSDSVSFSADSVRRLFSEFQKKSEAYRLTGGIHSAALADSEKILAFAEDIGRHNAVDKIAGFCILEHISFQGTMMMASGRLSSDIVHKCYRCSVPVLVSRTAPTSLAVDIADAVGITLVGFLRGNRMNIYTAKQRIVQ